MNWQTPAFVEINMSAEIGGYQSDFDDRDPIEPPPARADRRSPNDAAARSLEPL
jgi:hypothetical protein